jgi:arylsulfatase A-like enzyme
MALLAGCRQAPADSSPSIATLARKPNVLLVTIDTPRVDHVGAYGYRGATTPTLGRARPPGVRFEMAVAHVPLTGPSHASILTEHTSLGTGV